MIIRPIWEPPSLSSENALLIPLTKQNTHEMVIVILLGALLHVSALQTRESFEQKNTGANNPRNKTLSDISRTFELPDPSDKVRSLLGNRDIL